MSYSLKDVEQTKTVLVFANISNAGTEQFPFIHQIQNLGFQPDFFIVRSVTVNMTLANQTDNTYAVFSDLVNDYICTFPGVASTNNPNAVFAIKKPVQQATFDIKEVDTVASPNPNQLIAPTLAGDWFIEILIEFIKLADYKYSRSAPRN